ncbi:MAG: N-acetyltransferase [Crocinitomicaceae bacterium]|jgi:acetyltransferase-like isoleucine patch superfamily enzyme|nr:N-acetyltransferase [Crocinitomicaceae bacterium]
MIHPLADVHSENIGENTNVWQFSVVLKGASIGDNCNVNCHCFVENEVKIGNNVTLKSGVYVWDGITIEDNVFVGPNATFVNDPYPRSKQHLSEYPKTLLRKGSSIGAGAIILGGIEVGEFALVGAGSVVTKNVPANAIVVGNPAKQIGCVSDEGEKLKEKDGHYYDADGNKYIIENLKLKKQ